jgi:AcrR family transcriptional regulator
MTTTTPSRRDRLRTATVAEIKDTARRLLVGGGPAAISLRAIARDMGMTAPAIYRYFASLDALAVELVTDFFDELGQTVESAAVQAAAQGDAGPVERIAVMARAFRRWSLDHPSEFALMFGSPVPGITQFAAQCGPVNDAGARFGEAFLTVMAELYVTHPFPAPPAGALEEQLRANFVPYLDKHGDRFPIAVVYVFLASWTRLYGLVAMEVFGHLQWAVTDAEPLFELELRRSIDQLTESA